mgnify:FL=1
MTICYVEAGNYNTDIKVDVATQEIYVVQQITYVQGKKIMISTEKFTTRVQEKTLNSLAPYPRQDSIICLY